MIYERYFARQIAEYLLDIQAVILQPENPFTWSSGRLSPIYCDNRLLLSHPEKRKTVLLKLQEAVKEWFDDFDAVAGVATAGIPAASVLAHELHYPLAYVRSSGKKHGRQNRIEGRLPEGSRCLVVEDLVSTGGSSIDAADALVASGMHVAGVAALFSYGFPEAEEAFAAKAYPLLTLGNLEVLIEVAARRKYITDGQIRILEDWMQNPEQWSRERQT